MRIERATKEAVKFAVKNYHYSKFASPRCYDFPFSIFNDKNEFCGVICYGRGAHSSMGKPYNLYSGQYLELMRVALNGKQESTSKAISISIKLVKKKCPTVRLLISFADKRQGHTGIIYQATNWYFEKDIKTVGYEYYYKGKWTSGNFGKNIDKSKLTKRDAGGRLKYIYPLYKSLIPLCKSLSKPYPKNAQEVNKDKHDATSIEIDGSIPILAL
jgi:hypothetical protein